LFWTRVSDPSGTTLMDFEFNQSSQTCSTGVNKTRTADDLLIEYSLVQGGARAVITLRKWTGSAWGTAATFTANEATGTTNTSLIKAADTGGVSAVDLNARTFGEASIDLDAVFDSSKCTSFGSAMLKSRSSDSFTSQLKDFIAPLPITLSNCAQVIIRKQTSREGATELFNFTKSFATDPASADTFQLADNGVYTKTNVLLGSNYTVAETLTTLPAGWEFDSIDCSASSGVAPSINAATATATFSLDATSDKVDCTFYNKEQVGAIKVTKVVAGTTTALAGASFAIDADGDPATTGDQTNIPAVVGSPGVFCLGNLAFGSYTVVETQVPTGYTGAAPQTVNVTGAGTCASGAATATFENKKNPTLGTVPRLLPNDQATLSDGFGTLTGTLAFRLFANATCTGTALYSQDVPVNGNGPYTTTNTSTFITADGTYSWLVTYTSTSGSNNGAVSSCTAEQQKVDFTPLAAP
ncbi:MAG: prealbumin-like fold domain-containing protein, partial [Ornithinibacter sp.]